MNIGTFYGACGFTYPLRYDGAVDKVFGQITSLLMKDGPEATEAYWRRVGAETPTLVPYAETQITLLRTANEPLPNLLKNGSFERPLAKTPKEVMWNWRAYVNRNINAKSWRDDSTAAEGKWSGTVRGAGDIVGFLGSVSLACGGRYRVRLKYLTKQQTGRTRCWFYVNTKKGPWRIQKILPPTEQWSSYELTFTAPKVGQHMGAGFGLTAKRQGDDDQVWFDDVRLEELYRPEPQQPE